MSRTKRTGFYLQAGIEGTYDSDRDKKKWYKPDKPFKKMKSRMRKAKIKDALRNERELPKFYQSDQWDWN